MKDSHLSLIALRMLVSCAVVGSKAYVLGAFPQQRGHLALSFLDWKCSGIDRSLLRRGYVQIGLQAEVRVHQRGPVGRGKH